MTQPTAPAGWYADPNDPTMDTYWDGTGWTGRRRPKQGPASGSKGGALTPAGRVTRLAGLACVFAGLILGFWVHAHSVGVDGTSLEDLQNAHPVDCGTAFVVTFSSPLCEQALSGKKTTAIVLLTVGGFGVVGGGYLREQH